MGDKKIILIVNGYGCHLDTPLGKEYLPRVVNYIRAKRKALAGVIFTGGATQKKSAQGKTEAGVMAEYVRHWLGAGFETDLYLEQEAYTSYDNSAMSARHVEKIVSDNSLARADTRIVHFCEATRAANVIMLDRHFLLRFVESIDDIAVETASWERADPFKQVGNLICNKLAIKYPWLGLAEREHGRRVRRSKEI